MKELIKTYLPEISETQAAQFALYYEMLLDWNERMNLTAITEKEEVAQKHFADSVLPRDLIAKGASLIDVGTGAGFPGIALRILRPDIRLTLLDSLNKRVGFLQAVCAALGFNDVKCIHARAEDGARQADLREGFDYAAARAVASTAFLAEWLVPYLKKGGRALLYKGPQAEEELKEAQNAFRLLNCKAQVEDYPALAWGARKIVVLTKTGNTGKAYPRKAGTKTPL